jgi:uncharacterized protein YqhQ
MTEGIEEEPTRFEKWLDKKFGSDSAEKVLVMVSVVIGVILAVGLFMLLPTFLAGFISDYIESKILKNLIEGAIRIIIFLVYMWLATFIKDIKRVWAYHGAEHKTIFCYEKGLPLSVENVKSQSRLHPRCGTSFLFIVMLVSILVFSFVSWDILWVRMVLRLLLLPVVVAISYEIIKIAGRFDNILTKTISAPGKALQRLTTNEPDDDMIETAIEALRLVMPEDASEAKW